VVSVDYGEPGATFQFGDERLTVTVDPDLIADLQGCYTFELTDGCDDTTLISGCLNIGNHECTMLVTACSSTEVMGFRDGFTPTMRVCADIIRPRFKYEFGEERLSNGLMNRYYADRQRTMELRIGRLGEFGHEFISTLPLWDHVYFGAEAYVVTSDSYEPDYGDVYSAHGSVVLNVTPYQEKATKVRCVEDSGGCAPPPNYWVQGTGPNEDYILQEETGERILIN
jgi:hypothetical protein